MRADVDAAQQFIAARARVLDRRRFERLMLGGEAQPVRDAVAAYRNADGGFGQGLEPDGRTPASQPVAVARAQREDGGWMFNWPSWSPAAEQDWRGSLTVDALQTLRAYGRL